MKTFKFYILSCLALIVSFSLNAQTTTLNFNGGMQTYVVPSGINELTIDMYGAKGGDGGLGTKIGGYGGRVQTTLSVTPGQTLNIFVGGIGLDGNCTSSTPFLGGYNGGGDGYYCGASGGGASDIRIGGVALNNRVVVAGGGGGGGDDYPSGDKGGDGGDLIGANGEYGVDPNASSTGKGGTQGSGGIGGTNPSISVDDALPGTLGIGGRSSTTYAGGGGGGGFYGGGGGAAAGGGGGSSYADPALTVGTIHTQGENGGNGIVTITEVCNSAPPSPDVLSLPDLTGNCSVSAPSAPTASNCLGTYNGTPNVTFPITSQGTTTVTWTYDDGNGSTSTQTQDVVITDVTAPVADNTSLSNITSECQVSSLTAPTATDNCSGSITGTHNVSLPITTQGTTTITWTYDDGNGNTSTQTQDIIITDATAPVADIGSLSNVTAECEVTSLTAPTATDNCSGVVTGTHNAALPITAQGTTTIIWTYDDGNGNTTTQTQDVVISDITTPAPDLASLSNINNECEVTPTAPTATDNCTGTILGTPNVSFPITVSGTTSVTWTYDDGNGNTATQTQDIVITPIDVNTTTTPNGNDYSLSAVASGYNYQWIENCGTSDDVITGETSQSYTPAVNGIYAVIVDNGTCSDTSDCIVIDDLGIEINDFGSAFNVFPNPTFGNLAIDLGEVYNETSVKVFNALGQVVINESFGATGEVNIEIDGTPGIYILEVKTEGEQSARIRIIKN